MKQKEKPKWACEAYNIVWNKGNKKELIKETLSLNTALMEILRSWENVKVPDRYVADLVETINANYLYILWKKK